LKRFWLGWRPELSWRAGSLLGVAVPMSVTLVRAIPQGMTHPILLRMREATFYEGQFTDEEEGSV